MSHELFFGNYIYAQIKLVIGKVTRRGVSAEKESRS